MPLRRGAAKMLDGVMAHGDLVSAGEDSSSASSPPRRRVANILVGSLETTRPAGSHFGGVVRRAWREQAGEIRGGTSRECQSAR
jgi:hypothetical protein